MVQAKDEFHWHRFPLKGWFHRVRISTHWANPSLDPPLFLFIKIPLQSLKRLAHLPVGKDTATIFKTPGSFAGWNDRRFLPYSSFVFVSPNSRFQHPAASPLCVIPGLTRNPVCLCGLCPSVPLCLSSFAPLCLSSRLYAFVPQFLHSVSSLCLSSCQLSVISYQCLHECALSLSAFVPLCLCAFPQCLCAFVPLFTPSPL